MKIEYVKNEGYKVSINNNENWLKNLDKIKSETGDSDFSIISEFTGETIKTAEEVRDIIININN